MGRLISWLFSRGLCTASPWNDLVVQRALGEIDTEVLATALANLPVEIHAIFYRNMTKRATSVPTWHGIGRRDEL
jgi:hypothetical protein